jgi:hypothetical protein
VVKLVLISKAHVEGIVDHLKSLPRIDLQNDLPALWKEFDTFRGGMMRKVVPKIFKQGVEEGYVRDAPVATRRNDFHLGYQIGPEKGVSWMKPVLR